MNKILMSIVLLCIPLAVIGNDYQQFYSEQQTYMIEDIELEIDYLQKKVNDRTASEYEAFRLQQLVKRLEDAENEIQ